MNKEAKSGLVKVPDVSKEEKKKLRKGLRELRSKYNVIILNQAYHVGKEVAYGTADCPLNLEGRCYICKRFKGMITHVARANSTFEGFCDTKEAK